MVALIERSPDAGSSRQKLSARPQFVLSVPSAAFYWSYVINIKAYCLQVLLSGFGERNYFISLLLISSYLHLCDAPVQFMDAASMS